MLLHTGGEARRIAGGARDGVPGTGAARGAGLLRTTRGESSPRLAPIREGAPEDAAPAPQGRYNACAITRCGGERSIARYRPTRAETTVMMTGKVWLQLGSLHEQLFCAIVLWHDRYVPG
jgi:hypothetical protein